MGGSASSWLFPAPEARVLIRGLDASGKTTLLYKLKLGKVVTTIPTIGFNVETVRHGSLDLTLWDLGGADKMRPLWQHYYDGTAAVIYVVDSTKRERFPEAKEELDMFLTNTN